ncbi:MAG: ExeA family protein [Pirellulales bacterium]
MYEPFFDLNERPFTSAPRTERFFPSALIEDARKRLTLCVERSQGPGLLVGPAGTGKSLLCHVVAEHFRQRLAIAHLSNTRLGSRRVLLQAILYELGMPYRGLDEGELRLSLIDRLSSDDAPGGGMLLLVDEAQMLPLALLEEIRLISNLVCRGEPRVHVVLVGNSALDERFASPRMDSFNQRIAARCYLGSFDREETCQYIRSQIAASGGDADRMFLEDALDAVHRATDGVARLINQLCDHTLLLASAGGVRQISAAGIEEAWADLQQLPAPCSGDSLGSSVEAASVIEFGSLSDELEDEREEVSDAASNVDSGQQEGIADPTDQPEVGQQYDEPAEAAPAATTGGTLAEEVSRRVEEIDRQLADLNEEDEEEFEPAGSIGPQVELVFDVEPDPFSEEFQDEEVVIDQYGAYDDCLLGDRPQVTGDGGPEGLSSVVLDALGGDDPVWPDPETAPCDDAPCDDAPCDDAPRAEAATDAVCDEPVALPCQNGPQAIDDADLILVEDEPVDLADDPCTAKLVKQQEYQQLFQRLRRG